MESSGIDTSKHTVHSILAAASTKAIALEMSFEAVKEHAKTGATNQLLSKNTTIVQATNMLVVEKMTRALFGDATQNGTTSGVGVEPTKIVIGYIFLNVEKKKKSKNENGSYIRYWNLYVLQDKDQVNVLNNILKYNEKYEGFLRIRLRDNWIRPKIT
ncbi:unnamed protein product [Rhizopus stolonifer]